MHPRLKTLLLCWRQAYTISNGVAEWLLPIGSLDPTYQTVIAGDVGKALNTNGQGDCDNPNVLPKCYITENQDVAEYCGSTCYYCAPSAFGFYGPTACGKFKAPPVRSQSV